MSAPSAQTVLDVALELAENYGLSVAPCAPGFKFPKGIPWEPFQKVIPSPRAIEHMFSGSATESTTPPLNRMCVICGAVSGNLELLDFDEVGLFEEWHAMLTENGLDDLLDRLVIETTPRGGHHIYYRCPEVEAIPGNKVLARRFKTEEEYRADAAASEGGKTSKYKTRIETRGEGGLSVCAPTEGYSAFQRSLTEIPVISADERETLLCACTWFDTIPKVERRARIPSGDNKGKPGDDFNSKVSWHDVLEPLGWKAVGAHSSTTYWRRPGKSDGWSATTGHSNADLLHVFSSSCDELEQGENYSKFGVLAETQHQGDYAAAARALRAIGYGERTPPKSTQNPDKTRTSESPEEVSQSIVDAIEKTEDLAQHPFTDLGNAERLTRACGEDFHYVAAAKKWLHWDGRKFAADEQQINLAAQRCARDMAELGRQMMESEEHEQ